MLLSSVNAFIWHDAKQKLLYHDHDFSCDAQLRNLRPPRCRQSGCPSLNVPAYLITPSLAAWASKCLITFVIFAAVFCKERPILTELKRVLTCSNARDCVRGRVLLLIAGRRYKIKSQSSIARSSPKPKLLFVFSWKTLRKTDFCMCFYRRRSRRRTFTCVFVKDAEINKRIYLMLYFFFLCASSTKTQWF